MSEPIWNADELPGRPEWSHRLEAAEQAELLALLELKPAEVRDSGFGNEDPRSRGPNTSKKLSFHTDRSDVVGFLCLQRARGGGENEIAGSMAVYKEIEARRPDLSDLTPQQIEALDLVEAGAIRGGMRSSRA